MKAKIIKEKVTANRRKEIWEIGKSKKFTIPTIYILTPTEASFSIHGDGSISDFIHESQVDPKIPIIRIDGAKKSGVVYSDQGTIFVRIFGPIHEVIKCKKIFLEVAQRIFLKNGIYCFASSHRPGSNDLVVVIDGKEKKFCGCYTDLSQSYFSFFITLDFDIESVKSVYKMDSPKFLSRGNVNSIGDVVAGLKEIKPELDEKIVDELIIALSGELGWEL